MILMNLFFISTLLLSLILGKNNMGNLFGTALVGKMVSFKTAVLMGALGVAAGVFFGSADTVKAVVSLGNLHTQSNLLVVNLAAALALVIMTCRGIPVSITQTIMGALIALLLFNGLELNTKTLTEMLCGWVYSPLVAAIISCLLFLMIRFLLRHFPVHLLYRDAYLRIGLVLLGTFLGYALGANNVSVIVGPVLSVSSVPRAEVLIFVILFIALGFFTANPKVINTLGKSMFPLTPTESFISVLSAALALLAFSSPVISFLPPVPVPMICVMVGAIIGIAIGKGAFATLKLSIAGKLISAWVVTPVFAGLICFCFLSIYKIWGK